MERRLSALAFLVFSLAAVVLSVANPASASAPDKQGWWTATHSDGLPAAHPDVPADGLLVQGGPASPLAYAALSYALVDGEAAGTLTLEVAPGAVTTSTAKLDLCPLTASFSPEQGGSLATAPAYDCSKKVAVSLDSTGTTFKADVSSLVSGEELAIALLPGDSTSRAVLSKPEASSLQTTVTAAPFPVTGSDGGTAPDAVPSGGAGGDSRGTPLLQPGAVAPPLAPSVPAGEQPPTLAVAGPTGELSPVPVTNAASASTGGGSGGSLRLTFVLVLGAGCLAGVLWAFAGASAVSQAAGAASERES